MSVYAHQSYAELPEILQQVPFSYSKAAGETELSGSTIPQNKYGIWRLEVDTDGTVAIVEGSSNADGYDTPGKAVQALSDESGTKAAMGYVTATSTDAGGFVPGTTALNDSAVTSTFTDGWSSRRMEPSTVLLYGQTLFVRPKSDDQRELKLPYLKKPASLDSDSDVPTDVRWGPVILYGTAKEFLQDEKDVEGLIVVEKALRDHISSVNRKYIRQKQETRSSTPRF
jgi:hypothetical protein